METAQARTVSPPPEILDAVSTPYFTDAKEKDTAKVSALISGFQALRTQIKVSPSKASVEKEEKGATQTKSYAREEFQAAIAALHKKLAQTSSGLVKKVGQLQTECHEGILSAQTLMGFINSVWNNIEKKVIDDALVQELSKLTPSEKEPFLCLQFVKKMTGYVDVTMLPSLELILKSYELLLEIQTKITGYSKTSYAAVAAIQGALPAPAAKPPENTSDQDTFVLVDLPSPH